MGRCSRQCSTVTTSKKRFRDTRMDFSQFERDKTPNGLNNSVKLRASWAVAENSYPIGL